MLRALTPGEASRYIALMEKARGGVLHLDLDDPSDRSILDVCLPAREALELMQLHDRLHAPDLSDLEDTQRISVSQQDLKAVRG